MSRLNGNYSQQYLRTWVFYVVSALFICSLLWVGRVDAANAEQVEPITDLRILVDVSGSMKKNDPNNLRRDALRLLIGMLPESSRVGIWSFGQYVNMQVKPDFATKAWKKNALKEANKIRSLGLYTNIQDTLTKSSWDWKKPDPKWDRHMILLTDGMVDISKKPSKNKKSRKKILGSIVENLKSANVKIHTIALSTQADHKLLKELSKKTDGWYEAVESAKKLQRLFLRLFEKTTKMDSLPLEDNLFDVDESISNMTLLVFRSGSGKPTKVLAPDHSIMEYKKPTNNLEWFQDKNFDIITIHKPMVGKWKIDADIDKDNRVKIISNLKLKISPLPIDIIENESVTLKASIVTNEGLLDDKELLSLIKVSSQSVDNKGVETTQEIPASKISGEYEAQLEGVEKNGTVQIIVKVVSPTFKRESRHEIKVHKNPVKLALEATADGLVVNVTENPKILEAGTLQLVLMVEDNEDSFNMSKTGEHSWQAILDNDFEEKSITLDATANRLGNTPFETVLHARLPEALKPIKDPLTILTEETDLGIVIKILLEDKILKAGTLQLKYYQQGHKDQTLLILNKKDDIWQQLLSTEHTDTTLVVFASAEQLDGRIFEKEYKVIVPAVKIKKTVSEPAQANEEISNQDEQKEQEDESEQEGVSILVLVILLIVSNIIIFGSAFFGYRYWRKKNKPLLDDLDDTPSDKEKELADKQEPEPSLEPEQAKKEETNEDKSDDEDFSTQRKELSTPEDVDLDGAEESDPVTETDDKENEVTAELIEKSSADDLPEFDVDLESDVSESKTQEKEK